jgi:NAD(P)H dehydrogenase (quinone)
MLIIYAHPNKNGHCGHILKTTETYLKSNNIDFDLIDLYDNNYNPTLKNSELYTYGNNEISKENKQFQEKIKNEHSFIFIYPSWWNSMPAILKGFIDKVFTSGFAFKYENNLPKGLLNGKAMIFTTTGGPSLYTKLLAKSKCVTLLSDDILKFCGIKSKYELFGSCSKPIDDEYKKLIEEKVARNLNKFIKKD